MELTKDSQVSFCDGVVAFALCACCCDRFELFHPSERIDRRQGVPPPLEPRVQRPYWDAIQRQVRTVRNSISLRRFLSDNHLLKHRQGCPTKGRPLYTKDGCLSVWHADQMI